MLDSVIRARNKWLKPTGTLFPSHATMFFSLVSFEEDREGKINDYTSSMYDWKKFSEEMKQYYNLEMSNLELKYQQEQIEYYVYSGLWTELKPEHVIGEPVVIKRIDLNTCSLEDCEGVDKQKYSIMAPFAVRVSGFAGWFTVDFAGSAVTPVYRRVTLSTGPDAGYTHWGQQVFYLKDAIDCTPNTVISGTLEMVRQEKNKRLYDLLLTSSVDDCDIVSATYVIP